MGKEVKIHVDYVDCVIKYIAVKELAQGVSKIMWI